MINNVPPELLSLILRYLNFKNIIKLLNYSDDNLQSVVCRNINTLNVNINYYDNYHNIIFNSNYIHQTIKSLRWIKQFCNLHTLIIEDCNAIRDDIVIFELFRIIRKLKFLRCLIIKTNYRISYKNYILLNQLIQSKFLENLHTLKIPNIQFDAPNSYVMEYKQLFSEFTSRLKNLREFCINFKDNNDLLIEFFNGIDTTKINKITICSDIFYFLRYHFDGTQIRQKLSLPNLKKIVLWDYFPNFGANLYKLLCILDDTTVQNIEELSYDIRSINVYKNYTPRTLRILNRILKRFNNFTNLEYLTFTNYPNVLKFYRRGFGSQLCYKQIKNTSIKHLIFELPISYDCEFSNNNQYYLTDVIRFIFKLSTRFPNLQSLSFHLARYKTYPSNYRSFRRSILGFINTNPTLRTLIIFEADLYNYVYQILKLCVLTNNIENLIIVYGNNTIKKKILGESNIDKFCRLLKKLNTKLKLLYIHNIHKNYIARYRLKAYQLYKFEKVVKEIENKNKNNPMFHLIHNYLSSTQTPKAKHILRLMN